MIARKPAPILYRDTPEFIGKLAMREFELNQKLMNDTNEALSITTEYSKPSTVFSTVTSDMIEDQKIMEYVPLDIKINLEKPSLIKLPDGILTPDDILKKLTEIYENYTEAENTLNIDLKKFQDEKENVKKRYEEESLRLNESIRMPQAPLAVVGLKKYQKKSG